MRLPAVLLGAHFRTRARATNSRGLSLGRLSESELRLDQEDRPLMCREAARPARPCLLSSGTRVGRSPPPFDVHPARPRLSFARSLARSLARSPHALGALSSSFPRSLPRPVDQQREMLPARPAFAGVEDDWERVSSGLLLLLAAVAWQLSRLTISTASRRTTLCPGRRWQVRR
jgi:hypothetical protein